MEGGAGGGLTAWFARCGAVRLRIVWLLLACLAMVSGPVAAARVAVVLSDDAAPYQEVYQVISALLNDTPHLVSRVYAADVSASSLSETSLVVAVGVRAAESLASRSSRIPVLAVLVPRAWYDKTGRTLLTEGGQRVASAIYLDQPFERQGQLIRLVFPEVQRVGALLGAEQEDLVARLETALRTQQLTLVRGTLASQDRLIPPLENVLAGAEVLLAVPDPLVFNRATAQSLFLTSYRYRVPVLGYSRSLTRAGALLSLHSSPAQIGRQTAAWVIQALNHAPLRLPSPAYPAYFSVSINEQVARSLGFALPSEAELEQRLGGAR